MMNKKKLGMIIIISYQDDAAAKATQRRASDDGMTSVTKLNWYRKIAQVEHKYSLLAEIHDNTT